jgi:hypothetical protein
MAKTRNIFNLHFEDWVTGYDIFADIDVETIEQRRDARKYALFLATELKKREYSSAQVWDTSRGFHVICKGRFDPEFVKKTIMNICCEAKIPMSNPVREEDGKYFLAKDGQWIELPKREVHSDPKPNCDTGIWDIRRIRRVPHSLHTKTGEPMVKIL